MTRLGTGLVIVAALGLASAGRAQDISVSSWTVTAGGADPAGNVIQCERLLSDTDAGHARVRLHAIAAVRGAGSRCDAAIEASAQITVGPGPTRVRLVARYRGERRTDFPTTQLFAHGSAYVWPRGFQDPRSIGRTFYADGSPHEIVAVADSVETCLQPGTHTIGASLGVTARGPTAPGPEVSSSDFFSDPGRGLDVEVLSLGSAAACPLGPHYIGAFADLEAARCNIPAVPFVRSTLYILAVGAEPTDFQGAEFRIDGFPPEWPLSITPNPEASAIGNPLQGGAEILFDTCRSAGVVLLYTASFVPTTDAQNVPLILRYALPPSCPAFCCPEWSMCAPTYARFCLPRGPVAVLNGDRDPCTTAVELRSWSGVKSLYR